MDIPTTINDIISGAVFGSALTLSSVYMPSVIVSQMQLRNFHMLQTFLTASATSVLVIQFATKTSYCPPQTRSSSSFAGLPPYSGNVIGGLLIGTSMAITGACPGTVLVQSALGLRSGLYVALGGLIGGIAFADLAPVLRLSRISSSVTGSGSKPRAADSKAPTIATKLGISTFTASIAYLASCITALIITIRFAPIKPTNLNPVLGGLAIGFAQAFSVLLSRKAVGVSDVYTDLGRKILHLVVPSTKQSRPSSQSLPAVWFAVGIALGAKAVALAKLVPATVLTRGGTGEQEIGKITALVGGAAMVFGAHLADGCTSGHGISGMATLSLASFVTVTGIFGGGIGWKMLVG